MADGPAQAPQFAFSASEENKSDQDDESDEANEPAAEKPRKRKRN